MFSILKGFLLFSNIHGLYYIGDSKTDWLGRIVWIVSLGLCWFGSILLILSAWDNYENNSISFVTDTAYKDWKTVFPAVIVCAVESDRAEQLADEIWGNDGSLTAPDIFNEIGFFRGSASTLKAECVDPDNLEACQMNFQLITDKLRTNCTDLLANCQWNDQKFDCCEYFKPLKTELGICYAFNSIQVEFPEANNLTTISFMSNNTNPGQLSFQVNSPIEIYILSREEVPSIQIPAYENKIKPGFKREYLIGVQEIVNDPDVRNIAIKHRRCRYFNENYLTIQKHYSFTGCVVEERKKAHYKFCNCTHHLMPNSAEICNLTGLLCLYEYLEELTVVKPPWSKKKGLLIDCLPSCEENDITVIKVNRGYFRKRSYGEVIIKLSKLPTERFKRTVVRDKLDLIVSVGGTAGLFIGASVLSIVEIIYYFSFRIWRRQNLKK